MTTPNDTLSFFQTLWPAGLPEGGRLVLVIKRGSNVMVPEFHDDLGIAAKHCQAPAKKHDVYFGVSAQPLLSSGRGTAATAMAMPAVWIDIDFSKGFPTLTEVDRFLSELPLQPSIQVLTGGGVHAYWLLPEPIVADEVANDLELGWLQYCRSVAKKVAKAELDAVADLARVMRVPGTMNHKRVPVVPINLRYPLSGSEARYSLEQIAAWKAKGTVTKPSSGSSSEAFQFTLREGAHPPFRKWVLLLNNMPEIDDIFTHKVKMPVDNSISGYDLSIATRLDAAGWEPQEIVDAIIAHRTHWQKEISDERTTKDPLHLNDPSYYDRLLRKARAANERDRVSAQAAKLAEEVTEELTAANANPDDRAQLRQRWFQAVSQLIGIEILDLWAVDSIEQPWQLRVTCNAEARDITIGGPERLLQWQTWKRIVMLSGAAVDSIPKKEPPQLHSLVCRAGMFVRITGVGQQTTQRESFVSYLLDLSEACSPFEESAVLENLPFRKVDGGAYGLRDWGEHAECLFVRADSLTFDMKMGKFPQVANLRAALVALGFVLRTVAVRTERGSTSRSYYCMPLERLRGMLRGSEPEPEDLHANPAGDAERAGPRRVN